MGRLFLIPWRPFWTLSWIQHHLLHWGWKLKYFSHLSLVAIIIDERLFEIKFKFNNLFSSGDLLGGCQDLQKCPLKWKRVSSFSKMYSLCFSAPKSLKKVLLHYFTNMGGNAVRLDSNAAIKKHRGRWKCLIMACFIVYFMERKAIFSQNVFDN